MNVVGPVSSVLDLHIVHDRFGSSSDLNLNEHLHYPNDMLDGIPGLVPVSPCLETSCHTRCFPSQARESLLPVLNYNTPVKDLTYKDLPTNTFTLTSHERGIKTWCVRPLP